MEPDPKSGATLSKTLDGRGDILEEILKMDLESKRKHEFYKLKLEERSVRADALRMQEGPTGAVVSLKESKLLIVTQVPNSHARH